MCEEKSEQGHGRHCTEEWPQGLPWVPKNRPLQSAVEAVVPEERSPSAPRQLAVAHERWADMTDMKDADETCPKRHGSGIARLRDTRSFGAAFERQVLTLQTLVQVLDGSLKGPGAASSGDQTRSVNDLIQDNLGTDKSFS